MGIKTIIESSRCEKNVEILPLIADFVRRIGGLRCTLCKSGKDRTSMAVTWEQGRWLSRVAPDTPSGRIMDIVNDMRLEGVRIQNAFKNIGKQKFAFNSLQRKYLPGPYKVPKRITS